MQLCRLSGILTLRAGQRILQKKRNIRRKDRSGSMEYMKPDYYSKFRCTASECPETCCAGWKIGIDEKTLHKYRELEGKFKNRLYNAVDWKKMEFCQYKGRCELLSENGLCSIHAELGEEMLCETCKRYPRHAEAFENRREYSLSLSCPRAAEMILGHEEPVRFLTRTLPGKQEHYRNYDRNLFPCLLKARKVMIQIMQERKIGIAVRLQIILALGHDIQQRIDRKKYGKIEGLLERYLSPAAARYFEGQKWKYAGREKKAREIAARMEEALAGMETVSPSWKDYLKKVKMGYAAGYTAKTSDLRNQISGAYEKKEMQETHKMQDISDIQDKCSMQNISDIQDKRSMQDISDIQDKRSMQNTSNFQNTDKVKSIHEIQNKYNTALEQLTVYFLQVYFCGSVYDKNVYSKVKFSVMSTVWIAAMAAGTEDPQLAGLVQAAFKYAREMEHSDRNLILAEEKLMYHEVFSFEDMMIYTYHVLGLSGLTDCH